MIKFCGNNGIDGVAWNYPLCCKLHMDKANRYFKETWRAMIKEITK